MIENGCSVNEPYTILEDIRDTIAFDKIGQIAFMDLNNLSDLTMSIQCTVDACLPPAFGNKKYEKTDLHYFTGVYSCEVGSACQGRYNPIYSTYGIENEPFRRRRSADDTVSEGTVTVTVEHPCKEIFENKKEVVCIEETHYTDPSEHHSCWTIASCEAHMKTKKMENVESTDSAITGDAAVSLASATTLALSAYFML